MLILAYQVLKEKIEISRQGKLLAAAVLVLSAIYLYTKDFTYLPKTQPEVLTQFITNHFVIFVVLLIIGTVAGFYLYWDRSLKTKKEKKIVLLIAISIILVLAGLLLTGYLFSRVVLTLIIYLAVLALLRPRMNRLAVLTLSALTVFELG